MGVLVWAKPLPVMPVEEWKAISADAAPPGVYTPNMPEADRRPWKAKMTGGRDPRVEIRKTAGPAQVLIVVRLDGTNMSMNGIAEFTDQERTELTAAMAEAVAALLIR